MRLIACFISFLMAISFLLYPTVKEIYYKNKQNNLVENWEQNSVNNNVKSEINPELARKNLEQLEQVEQVFTNEDIKKKWNFENSIKEKNENKTVQNLGEKKNRNRKDLDFSSNPNVVGIIEISKIRLKLPILEGSTQKVLKMGAGHIKGTAFMGEIGNSAIAAHRSRTYGKMFNRLGEMKVGDEIVVKTKEGTYSYVVFNRSVVTPDDLSVLKGNKNERILTLITCEPIKNPTHRLIIKARIK